MIGFLKKRSILNIQSNIYSRGLQIYPHPYPDRYRARPCTDWKFPICY
jgi:hypothetical protein